MKINIKLRVTPEQSEAVQKICFANGIKWTADTAKISYTAAEYLFIEPTRIWYSDYSDHNKGIETKGYTKVDADLFIRTNGTCEESIDVVKDLLDYQSKKDMFKQYGFEVPDFDCTILAKVKDEYVGYYVTNNKAIIALSWSSNGSGYIGTTYNPEYNLTPIKKPWHETCKFPILVWDIFANKLEIATKYTNNVLYLLSDIRDASEVRPLSNEEIDQLKQDFKCSTY